MANFTPNYNLRKPVGTEQFDIDRDFNANWDVIDGELKERESGITALEIGKADKADTYTKAEVDGKDALKADKTYVDAQLSDIVSKSLKLKNNFINGNFTTGITSWSQATLSSFIVNAGIAEFVANAKDGRIFQLITYNVLDKHYFTALVKSDSNLVELNLGGAASIKHTGNNQFQRLSLVYTQPFASGLTSRIQDGRTTAWSTVYVKNAISVNLTSVFGAGNEPTKAEMDTLINMIGWFDGEITVSEKQLAIWTLNLIRQNRNAIVALGGTIV